MNELTIRCPICDQDVAVTADWTIAKHNSVPGHDVVCAFSDFSFDPPGTKMGCDGCYCTLVVDGRDTWPTVEEAVSAAHAAGWKGNATWSLCADCATQAGEEQRG